jgi:hypothetical protein
MRGRVALQGLNLHGDRGWVLPLCCLVPLIGTSIAAACGLFPGWASDLRLATCPLCHLLVSWVARHHLMRDAESDTWR